jgi:sulfur-oxidizing protein SoxX
MRHTARNLFTGVLPLAALLGVMFLAPLEAGAAETASAIEKGKAVAFDRKKGNCLACHAMDDGELPGNIGPPLVAMQARFPDKSKLRAQIWDATVVNPNTIMPPFGRHRMLSEEEIDQIVEYVYTL